MGVDGGWRVPTWRASDTFREVDLIEEVSRIDGVWKVPTVMPPHADAIGKRDPDVRLRNRVIDVLLGAGLSEAVTVAFTDETLADRLRLPPGHPRRDAVRVANPMGADQALLRTVLFPGLLALGPPEPGRRPRPGRPVRGGPCGAAGAR